MDTGRTGYLFDERFLLHDTGVEDIELPDGGMLESVEHPSSVRITRRTQALIAGSGLMDRLVRLEAAPATNSELSLYHSSAYIDRIRLLCKEGGGQASTIPGESAPVAPESFQAAALAVGGGIAAVDAVLTGRVKNAFALLRPPGHHAMVDEAMGFCIFNNVVIAARQAQETHGLKRVMVFDWDVHHGNGTQAAFYRDPDVLFISLHQDNWYPAGWGKIEDVGEGPGEGRTVNVPLPPGTGDRGYLEAIERVVEPIASQFQPELILVSAGQDTSFMDPLGRMMVTMSGFRSMAERVRTLAETLCEGRLVILQEGGYSAPYVPFATLGAIEGLLGERSAVVDPFERTPELHRAEQTSNQGEMQAIEAVVSVQRSYWEL